MPTSSTSININRPLLTVVQYTRIRDHIVIDEKLKSKLEDPNAPSIVTLIARVVEHKPGVDLVMHGASVTIIASTYDAHGCKIDVSGNVSSKIGDSGALAPVGASGVTGTPGVAYFNTHKPGGPGTNGANGGAGENGGSIRLICERLSSVRLVANGGAGGAGGAGGNGGDGGKGFSISKTGQVVEGTNGGPGGAAGNGGAGGKGGHIDVAFTAAGVPGFVDMGAAAGAPGAAGKQGAGGRGEVHGQSGTAGHAGHVGAAGSTTVDPVSAAGYWKRAMGVLGRQRTADWAAYRLMVGVYFYRRFKPNDPTRNDMLRLATIEFAAVAHLDPGNEHAAKYDKQIELGQNVLGLSTQLDLVPEFDTYLLYYTTFASLVTAYYKEGIAILLAADDKSDKATLFNERLTELRTHVIDDGAEIKIAQTGKDAAKLVIDRAILRVNELDAKIREAVARKPDDSISFGTIVTTAVSLATAVGAVLAAVPTAGTSLYALVPALAGLGVSLSAIGGHLFDATKEEKDALKSQYDKVGKNVDDVVKGAKATINLVEALGKLASAKTPSNAEVVGLMHQGIELAYELLLARLHGEQANLTLTAWTQKKANDEALVTLALLQLERLKSDKSVLKAAGRSAILATQGRADRLLENAFKAQRSVEIYTFKDESAHISFDSGFVDPDVEQNYIEDELSIPELVAAYTQSWLQFLNPINLVNDYDGYFASDGIFDLTGATVIHNISDAASLDTFRATSRLSFSFDLDDLPPNRFESKVEAVHIALVGATSPTGVANCNVRHGGHYLLRRRGGGVIDQALAAHDTLTLTRFAPLNVTGVPPSSGASARKQFALSFWGRGVCGAWEISLEPTVLAKDKVDLSGLTEIQLWVPTQCFIPVN